MKRPLSVYSIRAQGFGDYTFETAVDLNRVTLLIGPNGAGKTTFLSLLPLFTFEEDITISTRVFRGQVDGRLLGRLPQEGHLRISLSYPDTWDRRIGYVPQNLSSEIDRAKQAVDESRNHEAENGGNPLDYLKEDWGFREALDNQITRLAHLDQDDDEPWGYDPFSHTLSHEDVTHTVNIRAEYALKHSAAGELVPEAKGFLSLKRQLIEVSLQELNGVSQTVLLIDPGSEDENTLHVDLNLKKIRQYQALRPLIDQVDSSLWEFKGSLPVSIANDWLELAWGRAGAIGKCFLAHTNDLVYAGVGGLFQAWLDRLFLSHVKAVFENSKRLTLPEPPPLSVFPYKTPKLLRQEKGGHEFTVGGPFFRYWMRKLRIGEQVRKRDVEGQGYVVEIHRHGKWMNIYELGRGLSQFVSLLMVLDETRWDRLIRSRSNLKSGAWQRILEEPEANLHPRLQSAIADLLVDSWNPDDPVASGIIEEEKALVSSRFVGPSRIRDEEIDVVTKMPYTGPTCKHVSYLVETHSEYIVRRYQAMVAHGLIPSDEVGIIYFSDPTLSPDELPESGETVWSIGFNEDGTLTRDFGPGFFGESASLIDDLWSAWRPKS